jgi:hypothetical protein
MRNRSRMIAATVAVTMALAAGSGVAVASAMGGKPGAPVKTVSASGKPASPAEKVGHDAMMASVARQLHVSAARVSAALQPIFAVGHADPSSPSFAAAAHSLGVSTQQLSDALTHAKQSQATGAHVQQSPGSAKAAGPKSAGGQQGHDAMVASVATQLHVSKARAGAALQPLFAAGHADIPSPAFTAAARSLGVSTQQLQAALAGAKQSLAAGA